MDISKLVEALKEFFLEILGYLIPGLMLIICVYISLQDKTKHYLSQSPLINDLLLIVFGYVFGYVLYGIAHTRDNIMRKIIKRIKRNNKLDEIEQKISEMQVFKTSLGILKKMLNIEFSSGSNDIKKTVRDVRSLVMSFIPGSDKKIYTFMFRSELCNHLGIVAGIVGSIGLLDSIIGLIFPDHFF